MAEDMVDIPVTLDRATMDALNKMTRKELIERICSVALEAKVYEHRCTVAIEDADRSQRELIQLQTKLDKAESYVEQGRAMVTAVMERWYEYDA